MESIISPVVMMMYPGTCKSNDITSDQHQHLCLVTHLPQHMNRVLVSAQETGERLLITQVLVPMHEEGVDAALAECDRPQVIAARIHAVLACIN